MTFFPKALEQCLKKTDGLLFENPSPEHGIYTWKTKMLQVKTLPKGWCIDYGSSYFRYVYFPNGS